MWIILTGSLVAISCALLGSFLVLRKMAMFGDAISHAVLPGIVVAYLLTSESGLATGFLFQAAMVMGLLTTFFMEILHKKARLQSDATLGLTFTMMFAIGVILISYMGDNIDLDLDCVLYGEITYVPLDIWVTEGGYEMGPEAIWFLSINLIIVIGLIFIGYRGLQLTTFDPAYAASVGISTTLWHYLLMACVSMTTVVSFDYVGAILVVAFLVAPAATAYLLTHKLKQMLLLSSLLGVTAAVGGYYLGLWLDGSIAGAMTVVMGIQFTLAFLFSPQNGLLFKRSKQLSATSVPS